MIKNIYGEFWIITQKSSEEPQFYLEGAVRSFFKLNEQSLKDQINFESGCASYSENNDLVIVEGEFFNQFSQDFPWPINKKTYILMRKEKILGIFETYTRHEEGSVFDSFNIFIKEMSDEQLRLMVEFTLSKKLESKMTEIRDQMIQSISLKPSSSLKKASYNFSLLG